MKIAYLLFAYKNPKLMQKCIEALSSNDSSFFVHIDLKSRIDEFSRMKRDNVFFCRERLPVYWAEYSGVEAILLLIRSAIERGRSDYLVLLSGSEYPIQSRDYIHAFLEENRGQEFLSLVKMPNEAAGKPLSRINTLRVPSTKPVRHFGARVLAKVGLAERDYHGYLGSLEPYAGNTWWALSSDACEYVLDFAGRCPRVVKFFQNVFAPEELFFHTILGNSRFASCTRRNLLYEDWSLRGDRPAMITDRHLQLFAQQNRVFVKDEYGSGEVLFARKFSDDTLDLVTKIDEIIATREASSRLR